MGRIFGTDPTTIWRRMYTLVISFLCWGISLTGATGLSESARVNNTTKAHEKQLAQAGPETNALREAEIKAWRASRHAAQGRAEEDFRQKLETEREINRRKIEQTRSDLRSRRELEEETRRQRQEEAETRRIREKEEIERRKHTWL